MTVIGLDDAKRCDRALQAWIRLLASKGYDSGDLQQIQAVFQVAGQTGQTLTLAPVSAAGLHSVRPPHDAEDDLLNLSQAARQAGVSRPTLYQWIRRGELCPVTVGGVRFIRRDDLNRDWLR